MSSENCILMNLSLADDSHGRWPYGCVAVILFIELLVILTVDILTFYHSASLAQLSSSAASSKSAMPQSPYGMSVSLAEWLNGGYALPKCSHYYDAVIPWGLFFQNTSILIFLSNEHFAIYSDALEKYDVSILQMFFFIMRVFFHRIVFSIVSRSVVIGANQPINIEYFQYYYLCIGEIYDNVENIFM